MANLLGSDFYCIDDLDPNLTVVRDETALGQSLARRVSTPRLMLWYDTDYGVDARRYMHRPWNDKITSQAVEAELLKDERVDNARCESDYTELDGATGELDLTLNVQTSAGPYSLTVSISDLSVELFTEES